MAAASGAGISDVIRARQTAGRLSSVALREEPWTFQFFQAVRLLQRVLPDRAPVGRFVHPSKEMVRFAAHPSTAFPASQIQELDWRTGGRAADGGQLHGAHGPIGCSAALLQRAGSRSAETERSPPLRRSSTCSTTA